MMGLPLAIGLYFWCVIPGPWSCIPFSVFYRFIAHTAAIAVLAAALFLTFWGDGGRGACPQTPYMLHAYVGPTLSKWLVMTLFYHSVEFYIIILSVLNVLTTV